MDKKHSVRTFLTFPRAVAIPLAVAFFSTQVYGGEPEVQPPGEPEIEFRGGPEARPPMFEVKVDSSFSMAGETEFKGETFGDSEAFDFNLSVGSMLPLNEKWFIPIELKAQNITLDSVPGVPVPDSINTAEFGMGLTYKPDDRWMYMATLNAGLYKFEDIGSNDIGVSGGLMAILDYNESWKWMFGLMVQPDNELPVLPLIGVNWRINEQWELDLMLLDPRLTYIFDDKWKFYAGMGMNMGTTFRTEDTFGTEIGLPEYDDELGSYSDMRVTGGVSYQLSKSLNVEAEVGYSVSREIKYEDLDETVEFEPAPYVRMGLRFEF